MRVTANTYPDSIIRQLQQLASRQSTLQNQAATGQRISLPEDDPAAMHQVLGLQTDIRARTQYQENIANLKDRSTSAYTAVKGLKKILDRAEELAVLADGTKSPEELRAYGSELSELIKQGVQFANSKYNGEYLFSGTNSTTTPFTVSSTGANGRVTGVTYQGNATVREIEIGENSRVSDIMAGSNTSGSGSAGLIADSASGADLFAHLVSLQENLFAGNTAAIKSTDLAALRKDEDNLITHIAGIGALQTRLETATSNQKAEVSNAEQSISNLAGADLASTLVRLNETQVAFQAALQSGAKLMGQSLMDYLR
jgi:flagellar hook-associated protein 3 FlgL